MGKQYACKSKRCDSETVYFSKDGEYGWKLDVRDKDGNWDFEYGDQVETFIDEILPYLKRYADSESKWMDIDTGTEVSFWDIITEEINEAYSQSQ